MGSKFHLAAIVIGTTQINQITNQDLNTGFDEMIESVDGQADMTYAAINEMKPVISFTSTAIKKVLDEISLMGGKLAQGTNIDLYFQMAEQGGTRNTTDCTKISFTDGLIVVDSLRVPHNKPAEVTCSMYLISNDGVTSPYSITSGESLPAPLASREYFTMGPVNFNGVQIGSLDDFSINTGMQIGHDTFDGQPYPTLAYIVGRKPVFSVKGNDVSLADNPGLFAQQSSTDSVFYLRKYQPGGTRVADASAAHIKLTVDDGMLLVRKVGGGSRDAQSIDIDVTPTYDGTNPIVAVNTASAIA